jgi:predicted enzyme related to lactoylglutathione lyase
MHPLCWVERSILVVAATVLLASRASAEPPVEFRLSFIGMNVNDSGRTIDFWTSRVGVEPVRARRGWAMLSNGWIDPAVARGRSVTWEVFERPQAISPRRNARDQAVRPVFLVEDAEATAEALRAQGVHVTRPPNTAERTVFGFSDSDGIRFGIASDSSLPAPRDLRRAHIAWLELRTRDLEAQAEFFTGVLGLKLENMAGNQLLRQRVETPFLLLSDRHIRDDPISDPFEVPLWLSFETDDIDVAVSWLRQRAVHFIKEPEYHPGWRGTSAFIADPAGNPIQIVEYEVPDWIRRWAHRWFRWRAR